jgi:hypothetical protein
MGKYLTKEMLLSAPKGSRRYTTSRGIRLTLHGVAPGGQYELPGMPLSQQPSKWELASDSIERLYYLAVPNVITEEMDYEDGSLRFFAVDFGFNGFVN